MVEMTLHSSGVVVVVEKDTEVRHTAESMADDIAVYQKLTDGQLLPVIWDVRAMRRPTPDGWKELMYRVPSAVSALAALVDDEARLVAGAFPAAMNAFMFPARLFDEYDHAYDWLLQFVPVDFSSSHMETG